VDVDLEGLIEEHAKLMAVQMLTAADLAGSEEDIRHEVNKLIDEFITKAGLTVKGRHEYGLAGGRIDSKYGGVVLEYKDPKGAGRITENKNAPGFQAVVKQVTKRFQDLQSEENLEMERILGIGCDGKVLVFVRMRRNKVDVEDPQPVTPHTVERLLRAIVSVGARGLSFTPENLTQFFGSDSTSAQEGVRLIHDLIHATVSPKAQIFFRQWQILFGEVCGYDIHGQDAKIKRLADHYRIANPNPADLLFAVHTYYAIFIKLLAAEIVASFSPLGISTLKKLVSAPTSAKLREELRNLEQGGIWSQLGIRNFLEGDLFSWYLDAWDDRCARAIRAMSQSFDEFDPTTLSVDPAESRDLLKQLYQQLFPKSVRHDLGEYYTPDWLAELTLNELGYDGNPDKRLLDPACGSGTFLVMAVNRVKAWYLEHRHECGFGESELVSKILSNIIGFDLNPLAVMATRTNYLMAIRDLLRHAGNIEIPVYLCDSIMTPSEYGGDLFTGPLGNAQQLKTSAGDFKIPTEVAKNRNQIGPYADTLEACIANHYSPDQFIERCEGEGIPVAEAELHKRLYRQLQELDANNKNGIWARIIKNAFAPLFIGKVDYVAGNPPWINWESLPSDYRQSTAQLWQDYDLFRHKGYKAKLGGGKDDVSILMTYVAHDVFLAEGGRLGFVITQSVFKTVGGGEGFRTFDYEREGQKWYLSPLVVHDLSDFQPFEGATNRTAVVILGKQKGSFSYPVPYTVWKKIAKGKIPTEMGLQDVWASTARSELAAQPVQSQIKTSPWLTAPKGALSGIQKVLGKSEYQAYEGVNTGGLNGCFWIRILDKRPNGEFLIENLYDVGKIKVPHVHAVIEPDLVYALLRGRDVHRWNATPSAHIILANRTDKLAGIPEAEMKRRYPKTFAYLKQFEGDLRQPVRGTLRGRSGYIQYFKPTDPFYSMYNVGPYTLSEWKVLWPEVGHSVRAGVCGPSEVDSPKPSLPDHTIVAVPCESGNEAYFVAGLLNSTPAHVAVASYIVLHPSPHIMQNICIPRFNAKEGRNARLAELSRERHEIVKERNVSKASALEVEIDIIAANIWGISSSELRTMQAALAEMVPASAKGNLPDEVNE
jgi:hypothetical protein